MQMCGIYLAIAKVVNDSLNMDKDSVLIGSVLPTIHKSSNRSKTLTNPDEFVLRYQPKLDNPVMMGYLIHLLIDKFYNSYILKEFYVYDESNNIIGMKLKGKDKLIPMSERNRLRTREFEIYDKWLLNHKFIPTISGFDCLNNIIDIEDSMYNRTKIQVFIVETNKEVTKFRLFSAFARYNYKITDQKTLNTLFNECASYILDYIHKNHIR